MSDSGPPWCTIESDPELIEKIGVKNAQVEEIWSLDENAFAHLKPLYGLIFLFKLRASDMNDSREVIQDYDTSKIFFAKQVITNACATQAILSILMNAPGSVELGDELQEFKDFTSSFDADMRGLAISNSPTIRTVHNSFARPEPFVSKMEVATADDDLYHFISYLRIGDGVYELDGLQNGPIYLGACDANDESSWLNVARPIIQRRIETYQGSEIRFNLMAVIGNRKRQFEKELEIVQKEVASLKKRLGRADQKEDNAMDTDVDEDHAKLSEGEAEQRLTACEQRVAELQASLQAEDEKRERWKVENIRRKHNYIPFIVNFLKLLADKGELGPMVRNATAAANSKN